jgi:hypothetical protein
MNEEEQQVRSMEPEGIHPHVIQPQIEKLAPVDVPEVKNNMDDDVSTINIARVWIRELMASTIRITKGEETMATTVETPTVDPKPWYTSKTLWVNGLTFAWYFIGPLVGTPVLSAETTGLVLTAVNVLLRVVTKQPVSIS